jgi:hypothetical protein
MNKSKLGNQLKKTLENQDKVDQEKFAKVDSIVGNLPKLAQAASAQRTSSVERAIFSMPSADLALIDIMRAKAGKAGRISTTKSEIVRAGLYALNLLEDQELLAVLTGLQKVRRSN